MGKTLVASNQQRYGAREKIWVIGGVVALLGTGIWQVFSNHFPFCPTPFYLFIMSFIPPFFVLPIFSFPTIYVLHFFTAHENNIFGKYQSIAIFIISTLNFSYFYLVWDDCVRIAGPISASLTLNINLAGFLGLLTLSMLRNKSSIITYIVNICLYLMLLLFAFPLASSDFP